MKDVSGAREIITKSQWCKTFFGSSRFALFFVMVWAGFVWAGAEAAVKPSKETFSIQLSAFADKHNAEQFVTVLRAKGYRPYMVAFGSDKVLYKILMGPYPSREKAQQEVHVLSQKEKLKGIIIPAIYPPKSQPETVAEVKLDSKQPDSPPVQSAKPAPAPEIKSSKNKKNGAAKSASSPKAKATKLTAGKAEYDSVDVVVSLFLAWIKAWQGSDADAYLLFYSSNFHYPGSSLDKWKMSRRAALGKNRNITINFSDIQILQGKDTVEISFVQQYTSDTHADRGHKTLVWKKEGDVWRIIREDWLAV